jgi:hypothetical protein
LRVIDEVPKHFVMGVGSGGICAEGLMAIATMDDPIATNAVDNGGWFVHVPVQSQETDRRLHIGDRISKLLTMLLEVVVPMTKGKMGWGQLQILTYQR